MSKPFESPDTFAGERQLDLDELPARWNIGVEPRRVSAYVAAAFAIGLACGYLGAQTLGPKQPQAAPGSQSARPSAPVPPQALAAARDTESPDPARFYRVEKVLAGDVIQVEGVGAVRLIGVQAQDEKPSSQGHGTSGQTAAGLLKARLSGEDVRLEYDPVYATRDNKNEAGQTLAYVYTRDGALINGELLKQGLAFAKLDGPLKLTDDLRASEREAINAGAGLWGQPATEKAPKLTPLPPEAIGPNLPALSSPPAKAEPSIYISGDRRYHNRSSCEMMEGKRQEAPLSEARSRGYTPCSRCYPSSAQKVP